METLISASDLRANNYNEAQELETSQLMREMKRVQKKEPSKQFIVVNTITPNSIQVFRELGYIVERRELNHMYESVWIISWKA